MKIKLDNPYITLGAWRLLMYVACYYQRQILGNTRKEMTSDYMFFLAAACFISTLTAYVVVFHLII